VNIVSIDGETEYHRCNKCGHLWCYLADDPLKIPRDVWVTPTGRSRV
jgi:hypothetical protein